MAAELTVPTAPPGAAFLFLPAGDRPVMSPEKFTAEERELYRTADAFTRGEILVQARRLEDKDFPLLASLLKKAGELGLLMVGVPEEFGGLGLGKVPAMLVYEASAKMGSWTATFGAHTGIGTMPIIYYGTQAQKEKYLPHLATGERIAAYALSEPDSGSDALGARTTAVLSPDGRHYLLNGTKQWITNAAFADLFTVFVKVDGKAFTAFLVERGTPGFTIGPEEHKLGLRGSSTCPLIFEDARVPVENVLGEVGKGHKIAFNVLNFGRLSLGAGVLGGCKQALALGVAYAGERKQFQKPIVEFALIREKLARIVAVTYALESMIYRTAGLIDERLGGAEDPAAAIRVMEEYAVEASIAKVMGSEAVGQVIDEVLQIHGGNGFTEDYPIERAYRDARVNRIFEGTNEINRMLIPGMVLKRAMGGKLPLLDFAAQLDLELGSASLLPRFDGPLAAERRAAELVKRMFAYASRLALMNAGAELEQRQEVLAALADVAGEAYAVDSIVARTLEVADPEPARLAAVRLYTGEARERAFQRARAVVCAVAQGPELEQHLGALGRLQEFVPYDPVALREAIVPAAVERGGYPFGY